MINRYLYINIILCSTIQRTSICAWAFQFHHDDGLSTLLQSGGKEESVLVLCTCVSASLGVASIDKDWVKLGYGERAGLSYFGSFVCIMGLANQVHAEIY